MTGTAPQHDSRSAPAGFRAVNPHCLEHIVSLTDTHAIVADQDINDENGIKLWAKGFPVSRTLQEKLLKRRLAQPLEATLSVEGGATLEAIVGDAINAIDANPVFDSLSGSSDARGLLRDLQKLPLPGPVKLLLTSVREKKKGAYAHSLAAMIVSAGLASRLKLSSHDAEQLIFAALVHDIGEMYVNPAYLESASPLAPSDWKYVAAHPCVGHAFIREFTSFPAPVAECVLHHHERLDGSGYPFQLASTALGRLGAIIAVADAVSAIAVRGGCALRERLEVALRIVPEEFDRGAVSTINAALRDVAAEQCGANSDDCQGKIAAILAQLRSAHETAAALVARAPTPMADASSRYVLNVLTSVEKNLRATGVADVAQLAGLADDPQIIGEICLIAREVSWRLRNLARNVYLRTEKTGRSEEMNAVAPLISALDPTPASTPASAPAA